VLSGKYDLFGLNVLQLDKHYNEDSLCREADSHRGSIDLTFREEGGDGHHRILLQFTGTVGAGGGGGADTV
jgi:hypothetical protein